LEYYAELAADTQVRFAVAGLFADWCGDWGCFLTGVGV
jgi:hypothetical protein